jgi:DNA repair ATPase RecN
MADPLSVASALAGLLSLGIQVTQTLFNFYSAYKDQNSDLVHITQNLENLLSIFSTLDKALQTRQPRVDEQEILQTLDKSVSACVEVIKELQNECQKFQEQPATQFKGRIQFTSRRIAYPFRKSTLQKLEEDISDIRENLSLALNVLQVKITNELEDKMSGLASLLTRINAIHITSTIRGWLMAPDTTIDHNAACEKHHAGTGLWF